ncbi:delta 1-pyrroline-5-carboxylate reductase [Taxawa tesnikishii (nom. ined.)]|nr:delta 1-pyrroline-5-carboxylate reductase [Dothideales sp. JES 119]
MGIAVAGGIMASLESSQSSSSTSDLARRKELGHYKAPLTVYKNDNVSAVRDSDIVLLGCKPWMLSDILGQEGMVDALKGKLLISILAGVSVEQIERTLYPSNGEGGGDPAAGRLHGRARDAQHRLRGPGGHDGDRDDGPPLADDQLAIVKWMFSQIGLHGALRQRPAFVALVIEALADGAVAMGMPRQEASMMAAQAARGTTGLVLKGGEHPAVLREKVSTPGGCTIGGC